MSKRKHAARRGDGASSSQPVAQPGVINCIDDVAVRKYRELESQHFFSEIGFEFDEEWNAFSETRDRIQRQIMAQGWGEFVRIPRSGSSRLVLEFYANARSERRRRPESKVRGTIVQYNADVIREIYRTPQLVDRCAYAQHIAADKDYAGLAMTVCGRNVEWNLGRTGLPISLDKMDLSLEAKIWQFFINSRIFPSMNKKVVTLNRVVLISCILREERVNIAGILEHGLLDNLRKNVPKLYFPSLINELCRRLNIRREENELNVPAPPYGNITGAWLRKITRVRGVLQEAGPREAQRPERPRILTPEQHSQAVMYMMDIHRYSLQEQLWWQEQAGYDRSNRPPPPRLPEWFPEPAPEQPDDDDEGDEDDEDEEADD